MPPVCSWMTFAPLVEMVAASTSESMSASMTPMRRSSFRALMVAMRVVVLPLPGEDMRLSRKVWLRLSSSRSRSACRSLFSKTLFLISSTRNASMILPPEFQRVFLCQNYSSPAADLQPFCRRAEKLCRRSGLGRHDAPVPVGAQRENDRLVSAVIVRAAVKLQRRLIALAAVLRVERFIARERLLPVDPVADCPAASRACRRPPAGCRQSGAAP